MLRAFDENKQRDKLERRLSRIGTPLWYATQSARGIGKLAVMLYALNAGIQTMTLLQSEAYQSREAIAKNAYVIMKDLQADEQFQTGVEAYLQHKALTKPELRTTINDLERNIEVAANTQDEFLHRVQKIYNPLAVLGMN